MTLQNVPETLDRKSPWLREEGNQDLLRTFLYDHGVSISDVYEIKFEVTQMIVYRWAYEEGGRLQVEEGVPRVQPALTLDYLPGSAPTIEN